MEIDITALVRANHDLAEFSASVAERGQHAARETWRNACEQASEHPLLSTEDQLSKARDWFREFGAWSKQELADMADSEINALLLQFIAGDLRELESLAPSDDEDAGYIDWQEAERLASDGTVGGCVYRGYDGNFYIYVGV